MTSQIAGDGERLPGWRRFRGDGVQAEEASSLSAGQWVLKLGCS